MGPLGRLRVLWNVCRSAQSEAIRCPVTCSAISHQCEPISAMQRDGPLSLRYRCASSNPCRRAASPASRCPAPPGFRPGRRPRACAASAAPWGNSADCGRCSCASCLGGRRHHLPRLSPPKRPAASRRARACRPSARPLPWGNAARWACRCGPRPARRPPECYGSRCWSSECSTARRDWRPPRPWLPPRLPLPRCRDGGCLRYARVPRNLRRIPRL